MMFGNGCNGIGTFFGANTGYMYSGLSMLILGILSILVFIVFLYIVKRNGPRNSSRVALEELKMRFVRGEINEEEYMRRKNVLD